MVMTRGNWQGGAGDEKAKVPLGMISIDQKTFLPIQRMKQNVKNSDEDLGHFGADPDPDPDPYLWLLDQAPEPTPETTPFISDFRNVKKFNFFHIVFFTGTSYSILKI